jgi:hypothetical protein
VSLPQRVSSSPSPRLLRVGCPHDRVASIVGALDGGDSVAMASPRRNEPQRRLCPNQLCATFSSVAGHARNPPTVPLMPRGDLDRERTATSPRMALQSRAGPFAPIPYRTTNTSEHGRKSAKTLSLGGGCSHVFVAVRGDLDRKRTAGSPVAVRSGSSRPSSRSVALSPSAATGDLRSNAGCLVWPSFGQKHITESDLS